MVIILVSAIAHLRVVVQRPARRQADVRELLHARRPMGDPAHFPGSVAQVGVAVLVDPIFGCVDVAEFIGVGFR
ncbi:hypothetical protein, partial [Enterobacter hormaechei]|uniref:hypothetical protein n=1 Tax=Enterobacter hormaechei TaxID=158836 RepID=UPI00203B8888